MRIQGASRRFLKKRVIALFVALCIVVGITAGYYVGYDKIVRKTSNEVRGLVLDLSDREKAFPDVNASNLTDAQSKVLALTRQEFVDQPPGTKYSQGVDEDWCANFVSWIMNEAGVPLVNPHSDGWRIPGTFTLREYYEAAGRFREIGSGYEPKLGDVAIYRGSPIFGDHTNIVLTNVNGVLTTIGGNEGDRVRVYENNKKQYEGLLG